MRAWRLPLSSPSRPQRVEVVFRGSSSEMSATNRLHFQAPTLGDMPVRKTLWTVLLPPSWMADGEEIDASCRRPAMNRPAEMLRRTGGESQIVRRYVSEAGRRRLRSTFGGFSPIGCPSD